MRYDPQALRERILTALPVGFVVPEHTERGHFYRIGGKELYPSVTAKLQILKDEGLANWKMSQALNYVFANFKQFTDDNIMEQIEAAERVPADIFHGAGDIGTLIHDVREKIFTWWIKNGFRRPEDFQSFISEDCNDIRVVSAIAALEKFCIDYSYIPVVTEMMVYSHKWQTAGTLDDMGLMKIKVRQGGVGCIHEYIEHPHQNVVHCLKCEAKWQWVFVVLDLKSSNRFKSHYHFQVGMYHEMIRRITDIKPDRAFILKVSKENRTYQLEEIKFPSKVIRYANHLLKVNEGVEFIKLMQKDNQRRVMTI